MQHYKTDLKLQVLQVHKDYALGLEQSRLQMFPRSRPENDFAHLIRFMRPVLVGRCQKRHWVDATVSMLQVTRFLPTIQLLTRSGARA